MTKIEADCKSVSFGMSKKQMAVLIGSIITFVLGYVGIGAAMWRVWKNGKKKEESTKIILRSMTPCMI